MDGWGVGVKVGGLKEVVEVGLFFTWICGWRDGRREVRVSLIREKDALVGDLLGRRVSGSRVVIYGIHYNSGSSR